MKKIAQNDFMLFHTPVEIEYSAHFNSEGKIIEI